MAYVDKPLDELRTYAPEIPEPRDFDAFWRQTLKESEQFPLDAVFTPHETDLYQAVDVFGATFRGFGGQPVKGWLLLPAGATEPLPCFVTYVGYGGGRSFPIDHLAPAVTGFAHFVMDTRGQGSAWGGGETPDDFGTCNHYPGFMTKGIESRETYYYRRVFVDAVRAVAAAAAHPLVDEKRIAINGVSQGGGITIAVAGLIPDRIKLAIANVPFLCHYRRATTLTDEGPYYEIGAYLRVHRERVEQVFDTLAYFDGANFARRITTPCLVSTALMDAVCPPSTVFAAYNRIQAEKEIVVYEFNEHSGGGQLQTLHQLRFARERL